MKNVTILAILLCAGLASALYGQNSVTAGTSAGINIRAQSSVGIDLNDGSTGMDTSIDQVQLYFQLFQGDGISIVPDSAAGDQVQLKIGLTGSSWVLHWWNDQSQPGTTGPVGDTLYQSPAGLSSIDISLVWRDFWLGLAGWSSDSDVWPLMEVDRASLSSLVDLGGGYSLSATDSAIGLSLPILPSAIFDRNRQALEAGAYPMSGMMKLGYRGELFEATLKAGSRTSWDANDDQAWALGLDAEVRPLADWDISLQAAGGFNYPANPWAAGIGTGYRFRINGSMGLEPFAGADFVWADPSADMVPDYELGAGVRYYWQGQGTGFTHEYITWNIWSGTVRSGLQASVNMDQDQTINAHLSLAEEAGPLALIPGLGYIAVLELADLADSNGTRGLGGFALAEYNINDMMIPYIWGRYDTGYSSGAPSGVNALSSAAGVRYTGVSNLVVDLAYQNDSFTGTNAYLDFGQLSLSFRVRNF